MSAATGFRFLSSALLVAIALFLLVSPVWGQQTFVSRYDLFTGYTYLNSPKVNLPEHGFHTQFGVRPKTWYSLGFDYSVSTGDLLLTPDLLPDALQQTLGAQLGQLAAHGLLPPGYKLAVKAGSTTQTFATGPQLSWRRWRPITLFLRPSIGAIHETATPKPADPIATAIVQGLAPKGKKTDWTAFYGFGGGIDFNCSKRFALRVQADLVRDHLFNDILKDPRGTVRFSVGPAFNLGRNILE